MTDLVELAKRVEALDGPCRETDTLIAVAIRFAFEDIPDVTLSADEYGADWTVLATIGGKKHTRFAAPRYTASLDAAMTLVPEGYKWGAGNRDGTGTAWAWTGVTYDASAISNAATPALVLTAAALRALAAQGEG